MEAAYSSETHNLETEWRKNPNTMIKHATPSKPEILHLK
jgi:hypothetical protein